MKKPHRLIPDAPAGIRERRRSDGSTSIWWEPSAAARELGFTAVELDENRLTWSRREADKLNAELARAQRSGRREQAAPTGRTIEALIETYRKSPAFRKLADKTQRSYEGNFRLIIRKWGPHKVTEFTKPVMYTWYETLTGSAGDHQAVALIRAMSLLFSYAELVGWRAEDSNPCRKLKMTMPKPRKRAANWTEIDALVATADRIGQASIGTAILLSVLQGQRQTDVILATCSEFRTLLEPRRGGKPVARTVWTLTRSKRGNTSALYLHDEVAPRIRGLLDGREASAQRLLKDEMTGADYDEDLVSRRWRAVREATIEADKAGVLMQLRDLQFRDLRRTFGVLARAAGATRDDAADVLGNSAATNPRLAETYMPAQIETASRAVNAIKRPKAGKAR